MANTIEKLWPEDLEAFIAARHDKRFMLVDVRQPEEYAGHHIPGAVHIPLARLLENPHQLPGDQEIVFYCASGSRSAAAATMVADSGAVTKTVYNLMGGIYAWEGRPLTGYPHFKTFDFDGPVADMLMTAVKLEKGALVFYNTLKAKLHGFGLGAVFAKLAEAEMAHARTVYRHLKADRDDLPDFEPFFDSLPDNILEGGITFEDAMERLLAITASTAAGDDQTRIRLLEFALDIELTAYDLYRAAASRVDADSARDVFLSLSQAEKSHMRTLMTAVA